MTRLRIASLIAGWLGFVAGLPALGAQTTNAVPQPEEAPDFKEVYELVRTNLAGVSEAELNAAAVRGLVSALAPKAALATNTAATNAQASAPVVIRSNLFEGGIAYVRIGRVEEGLDKAVGEACRKLGVTNSLKGVVLDVRYARGEDYAMAAATADLFLKKERPLLNWGHGVVQSTAKKEAINVPVAVLVNQQTTGAAEALAAVMRETGAGLVLGTKTAGQAMIAKEFPLKNGQHLRIATAPVQLGDGTVLASQGVKPDIAVEVNPEDERAYYADAFAPPPKSALVASASLSATNATGGTNRSGRRTRFNEAELVRERRDGATLDAEPGTGRSREPETPLVHDPALARALDLLKGLAVVRQFRS